MANDHPLFIYRYMDRAAPRGDSPRFRIRVSAALPDRFDIPSKLWVAMREQAGIDVPMGQWGALWEEFFKEAAMEEVLTSITVTHRVLTGVGGRFAEVYRLAIARALADEHMGFRIDEQGVIHYAVDEVFEGMRGATLSVLNAPVLAVARGAYEAAFGYLDRHPADTKAAMRSTFEALEVVARQLNPGARNLHANLCRENLKDQYLAASTGDAVEKRVLAGMFEGMAHWVQSMHEYRHGQVDSITPPTEEFAVYVLSSGSAYLRLIAGLALRVGVQPAA
ncbi:MAG: hypothetical protein C4535_14415 [Comamonadaceae bacterium]|nr:MAG: hypothetical protein C4535_14415 [Comamonadaceae bacterium]